MMSALERSFSRRTGVRDKKNWLLVFPGLSVRTYLILKIPSCEYNQSEFYSHDTIFKKMALLCFVLIDVSLHVS